MIHVPMLAIFRARQDHTLGRVIAGEFSGCARYIFLAPCAPAVNAKDGESLKIAHAHYDSDYGWETFPILDAQAAQYGFAVQHLPVQPPGLDQKATWLRVKVAQPDWVILRSTSGVMTTTALKEAAQVGVPRDKIVGVRVCP